MISPMSQVPPRIAAPYPVQKPPIMNNRPGTARPGAARPPTRDFNLPARTNSPYPVAPRVDPINQYLTNDSTYQSQTAAINKALSDYQAQELQQENSYNSGYALNRNQLQEQQRLGGINQDEDYGSRGMIRSGLYATDKTNFLNDYARQNSQLDQQRNDYMLNLRQGLGNYQSSQNLAIQQARQDAINRRAIGLIGSGTAVK